MENNKHEFLQLNILSCDDNLYRLKSFPDKSIDLIYTGLSFFSHRKVVSMPAYEEALREFNPGLKSWQSGENIDKSNFLTKEVER